MLESRAAAVNPFGDIENHRAKTAIVAASSKSFMNSNTIWYTGEEYASNSPKDNYTKDLSTTTAILNSAKSDSAEDVEAAIEAYTDKRREEIRNTPTSVKVTGTSYFVSIDGNDANDGTSPETAWKTLDKVASVSLEEGDGVFFRRGDTFRGRLYVTDGVTYSAYGEGAKPNIYGSLRNYAEDGDFWQKTEYENIYVSKEAFTDGDVGVIVFNGGEAWTIYRAPGINPNMTDERDLANDLEMYHKAFETARMDNPGVESDYDNKIYLYSESDPNRFTSMEICVDGPIVAPKTKGNNVTIDNLCLKYTGYSALDFSYGVRGVTALNCEMGWLGGSVARINGRLLRHGNGFGTYGSCYDITVDNCYIYQIYDTAITHQYFGPATVTDPTKTQMKNIKYTDNLIEYCTWGIETSNTVDSKFGFMKEVEISGNLILHSGEGWGVQRPHNNPCGIMHRVGATQINYSENYFVFDNVIYGRDSKANLIECGAESLAAMPRMEGNLFVGVRNNPFGLCGVLADYKRVLLNENDLDSTVGFEDNKFFMLEK